MSWRQTSSRKKKAAVFTNVTVNAYQRQLNAGFSKLREIFKVRAIECLKYIREFHTPVYYCSDISTPWNLTLIVWHVGQTASWAGLGQLTRPSIAITQDYFPNNISIFWEHAVKALMDVLLRTVEDLSKKVTEQEAREERERVENIQHSLTLFEFATVVRLRREKRCRLCWERFRRDCRPRAAKLLSGEMALSNLPTRSSSSSSSITPSCSRPLDISSTASCKERRMLPTHPDTCVCASDSLLPKNCIFFHPTDKVCWESQWYLEENDLFFGKKIPDMRSRGRYSRHALASL